jgi:hypothetical protein
MAQQHSLPGVELELFKDHTHRNREDRKRLEFHENSARTAWPAAPNIGTVAKMIRFRRVALLAVCLPACLAQGPPPSAEEPGSRIWIGRHQEVEDYLRTAECVSIEPFLARASRCTLRPGGPVARMAWRPIPPGLYRGFQQSFYGEIAAYELDKLLKMNMVPPTVERQLQGANGAAQLWVENVVDAVDAAPSEENRVRWESQLVRMTMFDNLIGNRARNLRNMLRDTSWNLMLVDHTWAFGTDTGLHQQLKRIDADYWAKIEGLTRAQLDAALRRSLDPEQIGAILDRRERMRAQIKLLPR